MLSRILMLPFLACAIVFIYLSLEKDTAYSWYIAPCVVLAVGIYMMSPQIDWWWYQRRPPKLPEGLVKMFLSRSAFFRQLAPSDKTKFCTRVALYLEANEFVPKGMEEVPADVRAVVAASVVQLTFHREDYLLNKFEHIIVYPHPFPSPQYPKQWHASEIFEEDGVILFSAEQLMAGFAQPDRFFHVGLYEYARVFLRSYPGIHLPGLPTDIWEKLGAVSGFSKEALEKWVGLNDLEIMAVAIAHWMVFRQRFAVALPEMDKAFRGVFGGT